MRSGAVRSVLLPSCFPDALAEMAAHRDAGRRLVLVSGGLDVVLAPLARALGAELLAQRLVTEGDRVTGRHLSYAVLGEPLAPMNQSERKAAALRRHAEATGLDLAASFGYGDSVNDVAMLEAVGTAIAVNPDRGLTRIADERGWDCPALESAGALMLGQSPQSPGYRCDQNANGFFVLGWACPFARSRNRVSCSQATGSIPQQP